jgi:hypothetical protein
MMKSVGAYKNLLREGCELILEETQENARRDDVSQIRVARKTGHKDVALRMLKRGKTIEEIMEDTGLFHAEIR